MRRGTLKQFYDYLWDRPIIFVEGSRMSGKTTLARQIESDTGRQYYTTFRDRKTDVRFKQAEMDISQATIFILDLVSQLRPDAPTWVADRSTISTVVFDTLQGISNLFAETAIHTQPSTLIDDLKKDMPVEGCRGRRQDHLRKRYALFKELLREVGGVVVFQEASDQILQERATAMGRLDILQAVRLERAIYRDILTTLDLELGCVFEIVQSPSQE